MLCFDIYNVVFSDFKPDARDFVELQVNKVLNEMTRAYQMFGAQCERKGNSLYVYVQES